MNKIVKFAFVALTTVAGLSSCYKEDNPYTEAINPTSITKSNVTFGAAAAVGGIHYSTTDRVVSVKSDREWCTAAISADSISVSVPENGSVESRTAIVTLENANGTTKEVVVLQRGIIVNTDLGTKVVYTNNKKMTKTYTFETNVPMTVTADDDWLVPTVSDGKIVLNISANTTPNARQTYLRYESETYKDSVLVSQFDYDDNVFGEAYLYFINASTGKNSYFEVTLSEDTIYIDAIGFKIPYTLDTATGKATINAGEFIGNYGTTYSVFTVMWDTDAGYLTWNNAVQMESAIEIDEDGVWFGFDDNGTWSGYNVTTIRLEGFTYGTTTPASSSRKGALVSMMYPTLYRPNIDEAVTVKPFKSSPKLSKFGNATKFVVK